MSPLTALFAAQWPSPGSTKHPLLWTNFVPLHGIVPGRYRSFSALLKRLCPPFGRLLGVRFHLSLEQKFFYLFSPPLPCTLPDLRAQLRPSIPGFRFCRAIKPTAKSYQKSWVLEPSVKLSMSMYKEVQSIEGSTRHICSYPKAGCGMA